MPEIQNAIKSIDTKDVLAKMPNFSEILKLLSVSLSKILIPKKPTDSNGQKELEDTVKKSSESK